MYRKDRKEEFYTRLSKKENYPARSVYKLKEINEKYKIFNPGDKVLDLGCYPGSWSLYISKIIGDKGVVVGVDIKEIKKFNRKNIIFLKKDILKLNKKDFEKNYQVVVSDLAPKTSGIKSVDVGRSLELSKKSFEIAKKVLNNKGNFICKIFEGELVDNYVKSLSYYFEFVKKFKPKAVTRKSKEFYVIGKSFKK